MRVINTFETESLGVKTINKAVKTNVETENGIPKVYSEKEVLNEIKLKSGIIETVKSKVTNLSSIEVTSQGLTNEGCRGSKVGEVDQFPPDITPSRKPPNVYSVKIENVKSSHR